MPSPARAFLTCSARAEPGVAPLVGRVEQILLDLGWRTRVPRRLKAGALAERRRLRAQAYRDVEDADVVVHVPGGVSVAGSGLHHELNHAVNHGKAILIVHAAGLRRELAVETCAPERLRQLEELTGGRVIERLDDLPRLLEQARSA